MIAAMAQAAGWKVGLFTSPHLVRVEERFQINGVPIAPDAFAAEMTVLAPLIEMLEDQDGCRFTFFEIATALAWQYFARHAVDLAVMEVGLGGRFDSTNVCRPAVTVITSIGFDHMAQLGNTLEAIAFQKAGILKAGVPCVVGGLAAGPREVVRRVAQDVGAPLIETLDHARYTGPVGLLGGHQRANATLAVTAIDLLSRGGLTVPPAAVVDGLTTVHWPARIEVLGSAPVVILDCAHNVPSVEALVNTLRAQYPDAKNKTCIFAVSSDKQYVQMLPLLAAYFDRFVLTLYGNNPRCVPPESLAGLLPAGTARVLVPALEAYREVRRTALAEDLICITGSVFLAGELRNTILKTN